MPTFITPKTCRNASKIVLSRDRRTFTVYKIEAQFKIGSGRVVGKHSDKVVKTNYPATYYNKSVIWEHFGKYQSE